MTNNTYQFALNDLFTSHGLQSSGLVHDADLHLDQLQVDALAASGDCFVALATELDKISDALPQADPHHLKLELEKLTRILLYLQQHYKIGHKQG